MSERVFIVVGGGLAGLMATIKIAEAGEDVALFSVVPVQRSHTVYAQGGIIGPVNVKGVNDSPEIHFYDTVKGGDFLAHQPPCRGMTYAAPEIIYMLDRMGVMFNRTAEGVLDFRRFGGTLYNRTAFAGATTGQQLIYALDEQVRRWEDAGRVKKYEFWEFLGPVIDDEGICRGIVAADLRSMEVRAFRADATILATGGPGVIYGRSTNSTACTGSAVTAAYLAGAQYGNGEMIQVHPTAIPGEDKHRLMSESARGEGGRIWVPRKKGDARDPRQVPEGERYYFLEEKYPKFKNLVPRDIGSREIYDVCVNQGLGVDGKLSVYLDVSHIPREQLDRKLGGILEIYEKFVGEDPHTTPMRIFPAVHYSMGGLWVDYQKTSDGFIEEGDPKNHQTSIPGLYAAGECEYQYHGANRLGANALLSCIYAGRLAGPAAVARVRNIGKSAAAVPEVVFDLAAARWRDRLSSIVKMSGPENPYRLHLELGELMVKNVTIVRVNRDLAETDQKLLEMMERWRRIGTPDTTHWANPAPIFVNQLWNMLELARVITLGALGRDESRGAHYKPEFPNRDDTNFLRSTIAKWTPKGPEFSWEPIDTSLLKPVARSYD